MKIAVTGKGGVGKSTVAAALALRMVEKGERVLALDADHDANLASALGIAAGERAGILTVARQKALVEERTGAKIDGYGRVFRINPEDSDIVERFGHLHRGVSLVVMGAVSAGGSGCACPENTFLAALVRDLVLRRDETLIMDMEAGVEHLGRANARGVDVMLVVAEPGARAVESARRLVAMALEIGIADIRLVFKRVRPRSHEEYLRTQLSGNGVLEQLEIQYSEWMPRAVVDRKSRACTSTPREIIPRNSAPSTRSTWRQWFRIPEAATARHLRSAMSIR